MQPASARFTFSSRSCVALFLALSFIAVTMPARAQSTLALDERTASVSGWNVGYSKGLAGCVATTSFTDQTSIWIGYSGHFEFYIAFMNPKWQSLNPGQRYRLTVQPRGYGNWSGNFVAFQRGVQKGAIISGLQQKFLIDFARAPGMALKGGNRKITQLSLAGSRTALQEMLRCQRDRVARSQADVAAAKHVAAQRKALKANTERNVSGTGFFVSGEGHVLTNHHVVNGCKTLHASPVGSPPVEAKLLASDARNDLALLKTSIKPKAVPSFRPRAKLGENVYVFGFPLSGILTSTGNFTIGNVTANAGLGDDISRLQISAPVQPGNSGGPLIDQSGNIVGVVVAKLNVLKTARATQGDLAQNVNFAIKSSIAAMFLETNNIAPPGGAQTGKLEAPDIAERAKDFTVHVRCR